MRIKTQHVLAVFLALLVFSTPAASDPSTTASMTGTWLATATVEYPNAAGVPPSFNALLTFSADGGLVVTANLPGVTPGQGNWQRTGPGRYTWTFIFFRPNGSGLMLPTRATENMKITGPNTYETDAIIQPLDAGYNVLVSIPATTTGTLLGLVPYALKP